MPVTESERRVISQGLRDVQAMIIQAIQLCSKLMPVCNSAYTPADPVRTGRAVPQQQRHQSFAAEQ